MKNILFVCTGNTCRSSMAEGIFLDLLQKTEHAKLNIKVISAGTTVFKTGPANPKAVEVMKEMGIDISKSYSTQLTDNLINNADLILTMTKSHKQHIIIMEPQSKDKTHTLLEFIQDIGEEHGIIDISDPYGLSKEEYVRTAQEIKRALEKVLEKIV